MLAYFLLSAVPCQPIKRKKEGEEKRMTQEEMLLEAAETGLDYVSLLPYPEIHRWSLPASVVLCLLHFIRLLSMFPEIMNMRNLERVLAREEEVKKKAVVHKDTYEGPTVRFFSKDGNFFTGLSPLTCLQYEF